ncbi:MAG: DNA topoisomerase III [Defluviitaleaceae bacterium]|nr:DNA topoisomerase III [Defluviitaleaceae bacterium]
MKSLVIAEKPSVGKDIARVLGCRPSGGYMEGPKHIVTWALGHLVTLADPEEYDKAYQKWDINHLPIMPESLRLTVIPQTSKQYKTVKDLLHRKDVSAIVIATDAGREGELVARWIIEKAKCNKPIKRLWISSVTDKAIRDGFNNLKDGKQYVSLADSAKARAEADWLVGINATRCLTTKFNSPLSCGRVQTPTLAIIAKREEEIRAFVPKPYYGITADGGNFRLAWVDNESGSQRCFNKAKAEDILAKLKTETQATVAEVTKTIKRKFPPKLYDLTELQRDASKRFGYSPKETLAIMQRLYEEHKVLTYPRTDSRYISTDIVPTIPERLRACMVPPYNKSCAHILRTPIRPNANYVDNAKVSDHHAIIPTETPVNIRDLNEKERKIYDLVITRFLCVFYPPLEYEQLDVRIKIGAETFTAKGRAIMNQGYQAVYLDIDEDEEAADSQTLPSLKRGDRIPIKGVRLTEGKTAPPAPFNEATLLSAMESPAKYMETKDRALTETLEKTGGLGTVATRADIIEKLYDNFLIEKKGKDIFSTSKGRQLLTLVPADLKSPSLTGNWEQQLQSISTGKQNKNAFLKDIRKYTQSLIAEIKSSTQVFRHDNLTTTKCPDCGMFMLQVTGKKGEMLVCQDRECNARVNVSLSIRSKCPHCFKFLKIVGEGEKRKVVCPCGYKENYASFEKRKKEERGAMSKREVQSFIDDMNKKKPEASAKNNPFAALKGMKFETPQKK